MLDGTKKRGEKKIFNLKWILLKHSVFILYLETHYISHGNYLGDKVLLTRRHRISPSNYRDRNESLVKAY